MKRCLSRLPESISPTSEFYFTNLSQNNEFWIFTVLFFIFKSKAIQTVDGRSTIVNMKSMEGIFAQYCTLIQIYSTSSP